MILSLNQIKARLRTLALSHQQVNDFLFDQVADLTDEADIDYPVVVADLRTFDISRTQKKTNLRFTFYFLDRVDQAKNAKENLYEVVSDQLRVCEDYVAMLNSTAYQDDWMISKDNTGTVLREYKEDYLGGVSIDLTISTDYLADRCQVPSTDVEFNEPDPEDMKASYYYIYRATGTEGTTLSTGLIGKYIILHIRETFPLEPVNSGPEITEFAYNSTTGVMTYGTDLSAGELIYIQYRNI